MIKSIIVHTDGGCEGNPGPGGWAAVLEYEGTVKELSGGEPATTNNRMELTAAIEALAVLKEPCAVELFTDSQYVREGFGKWLPAWKRRGWKTAGKKPVKNEDLWRKLDQLASRHTISWHWLKGHAGHPLNERCDQLAVEQISRIKAVHSEERLKELLDLFAGSRAESGLQPQKMLLVAVDGRDIGADQTDRPNTRTSR